MFCKAILSIRTCLTDGSPRVFTPRLITKFLAKEKIQLAAITDINTCLNAPAFSICCKKLGISAIFGMEAWCKDKKALVLFSKLELAMDFSSAWCLTLPSLSLSELPEDVAKKQASAFFSQGPQQYCVDEEDNVLSQEKKYLQVCSKVSFDELKNQVESKGGLVFSMEEFPLQYRQYPLQEITQLRQNILMLDTGTFGLLSEDESISLQAIRTGFGKLQES